MWSGNPATYQRDTEEDEIGHITKTAEMYQQVADKHATEFLPYGTAYLDEGTYVDPYAVDDAGKKWGEFVPCVNF